MRCAIYIRVSTEEQANKEISSLDAQQDLLQSYIKNHNHQLVAIYRVMVKMILKLYLNLKRL